MSIRLTILQRMGAKLLFALRWHWGSAPGHDANAEDRPLHRVRSHHHVAHGTRGCTPGIVKQVDEDLTDRKSSERAGLLTRLHLRYEPLNATIVPKPSTSDFRGRKQRFGAPFSVKGANRIDNRCNRNRPAGSGTVVTRGRHHDVADVGPC